MNKRLLRNICRKILFLFFLFLALGVLFYGFENAFASLQKRMDVLLKEVVQKDMDKRSNALVGNITYGTRFTNTPPPDSMTIISEKGVRTLPKQSELSKKSRMDGVFLYILAQENSVSMDSLNLALIERLTKEKVKGVFYLSVTKPDNDMLRTVIPYVGLLTFCSDETKYVSPEGNTIYLHSYYDSLYVIGCIPLIYWLLSGAFLVVGSWLYYFRKITFKTAGGISDNCDILFSDPKTEMDNLPGEKGIGEHGDLQYPENGKGKQVTVESPVLIYRDKIIICDRKCYLITQCQPLVTLAKGFEINAMTALLKAEDNVLSRGDFMEQVKKKSTNENTLLVNLSRLNTHIATLGIRIEKDEKEVRLITIEKVGKENPTS